MLKHLLHKLGLPLLAAILALGCFGVAMAQEEALSGAPVKIVDVPADDPAYYEKLHEAELYNYKLIRNLLTMYEKDGWNAYRDACVTLDKMDPKALTDENKETLLHAKELRESLTQLIPYSQAALFIWDEEQMPVLTENVSGLFAAESFDNADFRPFLIPYLMEEPSEAKGNIILISGGGNMLRGTEAQDTVPYFVDLGYNCFVLHRRVEPYGADEIAMDLQRAIRYVKYHGESMGLGGLDVIGAAGFSGGGGNINTLLEKFYGDITPDQFDPNYICDEIDAVNSDLQIAMLLYSGRPLETENPNIPHLFIAVGEADSIGFDNSIEMFKWAQGLSNHPELHVFGNCTHGFGPGISGTSASTWTMAADLYIQHNILKPEMYESVPDEYCLKQTVVANWFSKTVGDIEVTVYVNSDHSKFFLTFEGWGTAHQIEGILVGDNVAGVTFDSSGFFTNDAPKMFALADPMAWEPVE